VKAIGAYLQRLKRFGTSIELSWGEDDDLWTLTWISGGKRYTAEGNDPEALFGEVMNQAARDNLEAARHYTRKPLG
jgi:hypothetical protein